MEDKAIQRQVWKNKDGVEIATIFIDEEKGIEIKIDIEALGKHREEVEELLTLSLYPPRDEEKTKGVISDDKKWIIYETKRGQKWELAKIDIVNTFHFWFGQ